MGEGFINYSSQVKSLLIVDILKSLSFETNWPKKQTVWVSAISFTLLQTTQSFYLKNKQGPNSRKLAFFLLVAMYVHTYNYSHICDTVYTMSTTISRTPHFCPKTIWHFCRLNHWKYDKTHQSFNQTLGFQPINDTYWFLNPILTYFKEKKTS